MNRSIPEYSATIARTEGARFDYDEDNQEILINLRAPDSVPVRCGKVLVIEVPNEIKLSALKTIVEHIKAIQTTLAETGKPDATA